jgi:hypothetical protein
LGDVSLYLLRAFCLFACLRWKFVALLTRVHYTLSLSSISCRFRKGERGDRGRQGRLGARGPQGAPFAITQHAVDVLVRAELAKIRAKPLPLRGGGLFARKPPKKAHAVKLGAPAKTCCGAAGIAGNNDFASSIIARIFSGRSRAG